MSNDEPYLRAILATVARQTFPPEKLLDLVVAKGAGSKQVAAYNMCDGTRTQAEIAKVAGFDPSNLSKLMQRWIDYGILIRLGDGRPLHVYSVPLALSAKDR